MQSAPSLPDAVAVSVAQRLDAIGTAARKTPGDGSGSGQKKRGALPAHDFYGLRRGFDQTAVQPSCWHHFRLHRLAGVHALIVITREPDLAAHHQHAFC